MLKKTAKSDAFRRRRANLSTRLSARGHGFENIPQLGIESITASDHIARLCSTAIQCASAMLDNSRKSQERESARCQLNRIRGQLGNIKSNINHPRYWDTAEAFMTVARLVMDVDLFEQIMCQTRAFREIKAFEVEVEIDRVFAVTKSALDSFVFTNE